MSSEQDREDYEKSIESILKEPIKEIIQALEKEQDFPDMSNVSSNFEEQSEFFLGWRDRIQDLFKVYILPALQRSKNIFCSIYCENKDQSVNIKISVNIALTGLLIKYGMSALLVPIFVGMIEQYLKEECRCQ